MRPHPRPTRRLLQLAALLQAPLDRPVLPIAERKPDARQFDLTAVRSVPHAKNSAAGTPARPVEHQDDHPKNQ